MQDRYGCESESRGMANRRSPVWPQVQQAWRPRVFLGSHLKTRWNPRMLNYLYADNGVGTTAPSSLVASVV